MELDINKRIPKQIERLIKQILPKDMTSSYFNYFMRLVSMKISKPAINEETVLRKIIERIDVNKVERLKELYSRLCKFKTINTRKELIYLLLSVRESENVSFLPLESGKSLYRPGRITYNPLPLSPNYSITKLEKELLSDLMFILEGAEGKYIKFSHLEDKYVIQSSYTLTSVSKLLEEISETACLYKKLQNFLNSEQVALANIALSSSIRGELNEYYRLIALMKQEPQINLKKVHLWIKEPIEKIKWLAILAEACETLRGSDVISAVFSYSCQGNLSISSLMLRILNEVSTPLMNMIEYWITEGDLVDPSSEFFIYKDDLIPDSELWTSKYFINAQHVPCFFDKDLVSKIFLTGKSINFLKVCCSKNHRVFKLKPRPPVHDRSQMEDWVGSVFRVINEEVVKVLREEFKISIHFRFIKRFMLLGQGDFHHSLMEQLLEVLDEKPGKIFKHNLRTILENAIRNSNFQYEEEEFLNLFDINFQDSQPLDVGWDVFVLDYVIQPPLSTVLTLWCSECYLKVFKFLFSVKRAEFMLNQYQNNRLFVAVENKNLEKCVHEISVLRSAFRHFINNFWAYLMIECVESTWKEFYGRVVESDSLEEMIQVHYGFLEKLINKCLINEKEVLLIIKKIILLTVKSQEILNVLVDMANSGNQPNKQINSRLKIILKDIETVYKTFISDVFSLLLLFENSNIAELKLLASRLDYNYYFNPN